MAKTIRIDGLSYDSVDKAIRELEEFRKEFLRKVDEFRKLLAERIATEAQSGFDSAISDDIIRGGSPELADVKVTVSEDGTLIVADGEDAVWVEFGAGVFHNGAVGSSPNPHGSELGFTIGSYGQGHGKQRAWGYYDGESGELIVTRGTPARMPMSLAMSHAINDIVSIAREVFT